MKLKRKHFEDLLDHWILKGSMERFLEKFLNDCIHEIVEESTVCREEFLENRVN